VHVELARLEYQAKRYEQVVSLLAGAKSAVAADSSAALMLATSLYSLQRWGEAVNAYSLVVTPNFRGREVQARAAEAALKAGNLQKAVDFHLLLLKLQDEGKNAEYAYTVEQQKLKSQAQAQYLKNIAAFPRDLRNYVRYFELSEAATTTPEALLLLQKAVALPDAPAVLMRRLALSYVRNGDMANGVKWYKSYCEKAPNDNAAWYELGSIYFDKKQYDGAVAPLQKAIQSMADNKDCLFKLGYSQMVTGIAAKKTAAVQEAVGYLAKARTLDAKNTLAYLPLLAECYRFVKDSGKLTDVLREWRPLEPNNFTLLQELGGLLVAQGKQDEALDVWQSASNLKPNDVDLHLKLAQAYGKKGDKSRGATHLQAAAQNSKNNPEIYQELARFYASDKDYVRAEDAYDKLAGLKKDDPTVLYEYSQVLRAKTDNNKAFKQMEKVLKLDAKNPVYFHFYSKIARDVGQNDLALKAARRAAMLDPANAELQAWTGLLFNEAGQADSARGYLERSVVMDKACAECYRILGDMYLADGKATAAIDAYKNVSSGGKDDAGVYLKLGRAYVLNAQMADARDAFQKAIAIDAANDEGRYRLVHVLIRSGDIAKARAASTASSAGKKSGWIHLVEGEIKEADSLLDAAYVSYSVAGRLLPEVADADAGCARVNLKKREYGNAIEFFGKAMAKDPANLEYYFDMGRAYEGIKEYSSANALYAEIVQKQPGYPGIHVALARTFSRQNDYPAAVKALKEGIDRDPQNAELYFSMGEACRASKKPQAAIKAYDMATQLAGKEMNLANKYIGLLYYSDLLDNANAAKYLKKYVKDGGVDANVDAVLGKLGEK
jgi:tetratricopeptide (TPR) repeat protein